MNTLNIGADDVQYDDSSVCHPFPVKTSDSLTYKTFCDPVHGHIELHPACVAFIDTPQFQRLRDIKQTGILDRVYPGATHNRFGHSLGVCHLANKFVQELKERQPELEISPTDVLCIQIAGLCHDLGHGPLSHTWEYFLNTSSKKKGLNLVWKHECVSVHMLEYLIAENNLESVLCKYGIGRSEIEQIKNFILGTEPTDDNKAFLYQIVNNDISGLDVDKWDYFLRDCYYLGLPCSFEYERLIQCSKVVSVNGKTQICFRDKVIDSVYNVFRTRSKLHRLAYQHRIVKVIERMMVDAFIAADEKITSPSGEILFLWEWSMSAAYERGEKLQRALEKFSMLTDSFVLVCLRHCVRQDAKHAVSLIEAIEKRSTNEEGFYQIVAHKVLQFKCDEDKLLTGISEFLPTAFVEVTRSLMNGYCDENDEPKPVVKDDICVCVIPINWGKGDKNPVNFVNFYSKHCQFETGFCKGANISTLLPQTFQEIHLQIVSRRSDSLAVQVIKCAFEKYWNSSNLKDTCNQL